MHAMSRNKENNPLPSQTRVNGSVFGAPKPAPSSDFFTDSILEDTSRIPLPSPRKHALSKPRRVVTGNRALQVSRDSANTGPRPPSPYNGEHSTTKHSHPAPLLRRPSPRSSQPELITPPQSRDGHEIQSPTSNPPTGLDDVYQRIHDEEELAATERESDEEAEMILQQNEEFPSKPRKSSSQRSLASRALGPTGMTSKVNRDIALDEQTGSLSEASGLSFAQGLTDQSLAAVLTPHFTDRARDLRRLQNISSKPIIFNRDPKPSELAEDARSATSSDRGSSSGRRVGAPLFGQSKINHTERGHREARVESNSKSGDPRQQPRLQRPETKRGVNSEDEETDEELKAAEKELQNRKLARLLSGGRSASPKTENPERPVDNSRNAAEQTRETQQAPTVEALDDTQGSVRSEDSQDSSLRTKSMLERNPVPATSKGMLNMWARKAAEQRTQRQNDSSQIDWAGLGADVPLPSVEESSTPHQTPPKPDVPASVRSQRSVDRLRRLDNDFTGMSFQVSESPPVRSKKSVDDYVRDREMNNLNKKALTTNRLDAIREKDPREAHRKLSRSPSAGHLRAKESIESLSSPQRTQQMAGEKVPDTPVIIYRSSSSSSNDANSMSQRSNHDRKTSYDQLQRLARAMSNTPRSSPLPPTTKEDGKKDALDVDGEATQESYASSANAPELQEESKKPVINATPKVMGAWTDTILPNTTKTARQTSRFQKHAQTPHVNAGGWIDTPVVNGTRQSSALAPMAIEEVTDDTTTDMAPKQHDKLEQPPLPVEIGTQSSPAEARRRLPPSILGRVLEDDTFDFGETTIESLGNLVGDTTKFLDERKAILTQAQASSLTTTDELGFIDHLGGKLREVAVGLHDTRKGISSLERAFMRASSPQIEDVPVQQHYNNSIIPVIYSTITFPIPLLFHTPQSTTKGKIRARNLIPFGRPTLLGYITLLIWTWYILECLASELFSHPLHAERYVWPPSTNPEPVFPFVLPTILLRGIGVSVNFGGVPGVLWTFIGPFYVLLRAIYRMLGMWIGWTDGFVDDTGFSGAIRNATRVAVHAAKTAAASGLGDDWSMMSDEII